MKKVNLLSGLPKDKSGDREVFKKFLALDGKKIICGSSTLAAFCRVTEKNSAANFESFKEGNPAYYHIEGIDFASEGAVTLNHCFKFLSCGEVLSKTGEELGKLLSECDEINFFIGSAENKNQTQDFFKKHEMLPRAEITEKIKDVLAKYKKKVNIKKF
ncbi:hypothetical protein [Endomicrobium proavitum]|uniref:Cell division protein FtsQ n=1 Tax=Endomicrobium proavitum TaxID=1408281 RepID=A0A0G3WHY2_9BACT|nr:hypothetical protein [Endomicrobium proavitum]AKL98296.1 cell division protein FtsQ [Endomicrobium proavitum]